jgi:hypothetical protein
MAAATVRRHRFDPGGVPVEVAVIVHGLSMNDVTQELDSVICKWRLQRLKRVSAQQHSPDHHAKKCKTAVESHCCVPFATAPAGKPP